MLVLVLTRLFLAVPPVLHPPLVLLLAQQAASDALEEAATVLK